MVFFGPGAFCLPGVGEGVPVRRLRSAFDRFARGILFAALPLMSATFDARMVAQSGARVEAAQRGLARAVDFDGPVRRWGSLVAMASDEEGGESSSVTASGGGEEAAAAESKRTWRDIVPVYDHPVRPFSEFGGALKLSTLGPGFDLVTPLLRTVNLRASANFFDVGASLLNKGVEYHAELHLRSGGVSVDWFPLHGGFHLSPGVMIFDPRIAGGILIPGGKVYMLNDQTFTSSVSDPVHGDGQLAFSRRVAPSLAVGFANIIPRSGKRLTVPIEFGLVYVGHSTVSISLAGTACQPDGCEDVATDGDSQFDLREELYDINEDLKRAQVFPILSIGIGYRF